ncbi:MAG: hypothetical protein ACM31O_04515 [Bacteroidota bacterium]
MAPLKLRPSDIAFLQRIAAHNEATGKFFPVKELPDTTQRLIRQKLLERDQRQAGLHVRITPRGREAAGL